MFINPGVFSRVCFNEQPSSNIQSGKMLTGSGIKVKKGTAESLKGFLVVIILGHVYLLKRWYSGGFLEGTCFFCVRDKL